MICPNPNCGYQGRALTGTVMGVPGNPPIFSAVHPLSLSHWAAGDSGVWGLALGFWGCSGLTR